MSLSELEEMHGGIPLSRAKGWDTSKKKIWPASELAHDQLTLMPDGSGFINVSGDSPRLSQFMRHIIPLHSTGKRDLDGAEIFRGDVLECAQKRSESIDYWWGLPEGAHPEVVVQWDPDKCQFVLPADVSINWRNTGSVFEREVRTDG